MARQIVSRIILVVSRIRPRLSISRGEEKFRSLISAILCLEILSPCSLPRDYRERRLQNVCFEKIYKLRGSKIRGSERNNPGNLSKLFCRDFSRIRKIFLLILAAPLINFIPSFLPPPLPPLENFLSVRFFFTPELIFRRIYSTAMADFYMYNSTSTKILGTDLFPTVREHSL